MTTSMLYLVDGKLQLEMDWEELEHASRDSTKLVLNDVHDVMLEFIPTHPPHLRCLFRKI